MKKNIKIVKKIKSVSKSAAKKTGVFMKNVKKQSGKMVNALKKEWKKEEPLREEYRKKIEDAADKVGKKGMEMFKEGIKNTIKIGGDVADTIGKDIKEINKNK